MPWWRRASWAKGTDHVREAEALAEALGDERRLGWALGRLTDHAWNAGDPDRALDLGQRALAISVGPMMTSRSRHGEPARRYGLADEGGLSTRPSSASAGVAEARQGDRLYDRWSTGAIALSSARDRLAWCLAELGEFPEAMARHRGGRSDRSRGRPSPQPRLAYRSLGLVLLRRGDIPGAIPPLERAVELCRAIPAQVLFDVVRRALGYAYALSGRLPEGVALMEAALADPATTGTTNHPLFLAYLGEAHFLAGRGRMRSRWPGAPSTSPTGRRSGATRRGCCASSARSPRRPTLQTWSQPEEHYSRALARAEELGMRPLVAHCHLGLGRLYRQAGDDAKAQEHLTTAKAMYRGMDMTFWLEKADAELGGVER